MSNIVSFPNFLCLLLTGTLIFHLVSKDRVSMGMEAPDRLEERYCRLPQSYRLEDTLYCSSAQKLFLLLGNDCSLEQTRILEVEDSINDTVLKDELSDIYEEVVTVEVPEEGGVVEKKEPLEKVKSSIVDDSFRMTKEVYFVISCLVCSALVSLRGWHREKTSNKRQIPAAGSGGSNVRDWEAQFDRRISIADLTVNRHIRRGDCQQLESIRQNMATGSKPPLLRRSSFPAQLPESRSRHAPQRQLSTPASPMGRRMSEDLGDGFPDRRRVRLIRRH